MAQQQDWVPQGLDTSVPSGARTYDFLLGGGHNFAVDREAGIRGERAMPGLRQLARLNRAFLGRAVRFMVDAGIRQFLDIGSGIPTVGNVHEIAQRTGPECRVVYVDRDPVAVAHCELLLAGNDRAAIVHADLRDPEGILGSPEARRLLNLDEPVGLLMLTVLHWIPDESDPPALLVRYRDALAGGSYLAITHLTADQQKDKITNAVAGFNRSKGDQATLRTHAQISAMFGDLVLVEPGLVGCALWRPDGPGDITDEPEMNAQIYGGVASKPRRA